MFGKRSFLSRFFISSQNQKRSITVNTIPAEPRGTPPVVANCLVVKGKVADLSKFLSEVGGCKVTWRGVGEYSPLNFDSIVPLPQSEVDCVWRGGGQIELERLRFAHWRINSDVAGCRLKEQSHTLTFWFGTSGEAPIYLVQVLIARYPQLKLHLSFDRRDLNGVVIGRNGLSFVWVKNKFPKERAA